MMKSSKRIFAALFAVLAIFSLTACASRQTQTGAPAQTTQQPAQQETPAQDNEADADTGETEEPSQESDAETEPAEEVNAKGSKTLVVYYSASGNTAKVANDIADALGADTFELVPQEPYTTEDLNWSASDSRVNQEHEDETLRDVALVTGTVENWDEYDTIFLGYPIWWGIAAWPVNNFVKNNDFTGKTVIPFCTSASSGIGQSGELLSEMAGTGDWQEGQRFSSNVSDDTIRNWLSELGL